MEAIMSLDKQMKAYKSVTIKKELKKNNFTVRININHKHAHTCHLCQMMFTEENNLIKHLKGFHGAGKVAFKCKKCKQKFSSEKALKKHNLAHHSTREQSKCHMCKKVFTFKYDLKMHLLYSHRVLQERIKCHLCEKDYTMKHNLKRHLLYSHRIIQERIKCHLCEKDYTMKQNLQRHLIQAHQVAPMFCLVCNKRFFEETDLQAHLKIHSENTRDLSFVKSDRKQEPGKCDCCQEVICKVLKCNDSVKMHKTLGKCRGNGYHKEFSTSRNQKEFSTPRNHKKYSTLRNQEGFSTPKVICKVPNLSNCTETHKKLGEKRRNVYQEEFHTPTNQQEFSAPKNREKFSIPRNQEGFSVPRNQEGTFTPRNQEEYSTPRNQKEFSIPRNQKEFSIPRNQEGFFTPRNQEEFSTPRNQEKFSTSRNHKQRITAHFNASSFPDSKETDLVKKGEESEKLACEYCNQEFNHKRYLSRHLKHHCKGGLFTCSICNVKFREKIHLVLHRRLHLGFIARTSTNDADRGIRMVAVPCNTPGVFCNVCKMIQYSPTSFRNHMMLHYGKKLFEYEDCKTKFFNKSQLDRKKLFEYKDCKTKFINKSQLDRHELVHRDKKLYSCEVCPETFYRKVNLESHMRCHNSDKKSNLKPTQKKNSKLERLHSSDTKSHIQEKQSTDDNNEKEFIGVQRGVISLRKDDDKPEQLQSTSLADNTTYTMPGQSQAAEQKICSEHSDVRHLASSSEQSPLSCDKCSRTFRKKTQKDEHIFLYSNQEPFACKICDLKFCEGLWFTRHMKFHCFDNGVTCNNLRNTENKSRLTRHLEVSDKQKYVICEICQLRFNSELEYLDHMKAHPVKPMKYSSCPKIFRYNERHFENNNTKDPSHSITHKIRVVQEHLDEPQESNQELGRKVTEYAYPKETDHVLLNNISSGIHLQDVHQYKETDMDLDTHVLTGKEDRYKLNKKLSLNIYPEGTSLNKVERTPSVGNRESLQDEPESTMSQRRKFDDFEIKKQFSCNLCQKTFDSRILLRCHQKLHPKKKYVCKMNRLKTRRPFKNRNLRASALDDIQKYYMARALTTKIARLSCTRDGYDKERPNFLDIDMASYVKDTSLKRKRCRANYLKEQQYRKHSLEGFDSKDNGHSFLNGWPTTAGTERINIGSSDPPENDEFSEPFELPDLEISQYEASEEKCCNKAKFVCNKKTQKIKTLCRETVGKEYIGTHNHKYLGNHNNVTKSFNSELSLSNGKSLSCKARLHSKKNLRTKTCDNVTEGDSAVYSLMDYSNESDLPDLNIQVDRPTVLEEICNRELCSDELDDDHREVSNHQTYIKVDSPTVPQEICNQKSSVDELDDDYRETNSHQTFMDELQESKNLEDKGLIENEEQKMQILDQFHSEELKVELEEKEFLQENEAFYLEKSLLTIAEKGHYVAELNSNPFSLSNHNASEQLIPEETVASLYEYFIADSWMMM